MVNCTLYAVKPCFLTNGAAYFVLDAQNSFANDDSVKQDHVLKNTQMRYVLKLRPLILQEFWCQYKLIAF